MALPKGIVNDSSSSVSIGAASAYLQPPSISTGAIDDFYHNQKQLAKLATPDLLAEHPSLGSLILVGSVSATESYFRSIFTQILSLCPIARASVSTQVVSRQSIDWYTSKHVDWGLLEHRSFASKKELEAAIDLFTKFKTSDFGPLLSEFDKVCNLRHCIVHCNSQIAGRNAIELEVGPDRIFQVIRPSLGQIHECLGVCLNLVQEFNHLAFHSLLVRWKTKWPDAPCGQWSKDRFKFIKIHTIFSSKSDYAAGKSLNARDCYSACVKALKIK